MLTANYEKFGISLASIRGSGSSLLETCTAHPLPLIRLYLVLLSTYSYVLSTAFDFKLLKVKTQGMPFTRNIVGTVTLEQGNPGSCTPTE